MSFAEHINWPPDEIEPPSFEFTVDGVPHTVPRQNSLIRRFEQGEGGFDYLVHYGADGHLVFMPSDEEGLKLLEDLEKDGFPVEILPDIDDQARRVIIDMQLIDINGSAS